MKAFTPLAAALLFPLMLTSCKEAEQVQADYKAAVEEMNTKRAEYEALEQKLADLRKAVPPSASPADSARRMMAALQNELEYLEQQLASATQDQQEASAALEKMQTETDTLKKELTR